MPGGWHITRGGQTYGPYTWEQIAEFARGGLITRRDMVFDPRNGAWSKPSDVAGLFGPGGAAAAPAALSKAAMAAVGVVVMLAIPIMLLLAFALLTAQGRTEIDPSAGLAGVSTGGSAPSVATDDIPPEGLAYRGTFHWESVEGLGVPNLVHVEPFFMWIHTTDEGTAASFDYGDSFVDGFPVYLESQSGTRYTFVSSSRSLVDTVRIVADVTDSAVSGSVQDTNENVGAFVGGTFAGSAISYDEYRAAVID